MPATKPMTAEEFCNWLRRPTDEGTNWELDRGRPVAIPFGSERHGFVCANVNGVLGNYIIPRRCGYLCMGTGVIVERNPDTVLGPDVAYYAIESARELGDFFAITPPLLAVEVLDRSDRITPTLRRAGRFIKAGVKALWLVDTKEPAVIVCRAGKGIQVLEETDELRADDVLPDFRCHVADFFRLPGQ